MTVNPEFALALIVALLGAAGSFFAVRFGGQESQRLVKALHGRFDKLEDDVRTVREGPARHDERTKALKQSQQFRLHRNLGSTAAEAEQDMFISGEGE